VIRPHPRGDIGQDGGLDERARPVDPLAAGAQRGALVHGVPDLAHQALGGRLRGQRPQVRGGVRGIARTQGGHRGGELVGELVVEITDDDDPLGRGAGLAGIVHSAGDRRFHGLGDVVAVQHDEGGPTQAERVWA
jgi:hypothetical protein